jgi:RHS repeat-associated protein
MTKKTGIGGWDVLTWESDVNRPRIRPKSVRFDAEVAGIAQRNVVNNQDQKPIQITYQGSTTNLYYDGAGDRIKKVKGAETVVYVGEIFEVRNGQAMSYIYANGQKIVTLANNKEYYTHSDHLGSTAIVTDETGTVVEEIGYLPFGSTLFRIAYNGSTWESAYRFTGQELDSEYELYNYNARLYDPVMSRFISPDTIVPEPYNPQSLNRYSYCLNNPLKYVDPSGNYAGVYAPGTNPWSSVDWWNSVNGGDPYMIRLLGPVMGPAAYAEMERMHIVMKTYEVKLEKFTDDDGNIWGDREYISKGYYFIAVPNTDQFMRDLTYAGGVSDTFPSIHNAVASAIYGETSGVRPGNSTAEQFMQARQKIGHVYINGNKSMRIALPNLNNPIEKEQWILCRMAAWRALLCDQDLTNGAKYYNIREATQTDPTTRAHAIFGTVSTSDGPFNNGAGGGDVNTGSVYINTYTGRKP